MEPSQYPNRRIDKPPRMGRVGDLEWSPTFSVVWRAGEGCAGAAYRVAMSDALTLCVLLWAVDGRAAELAEYEDNVLALIAEHGGEVINRFQNVNEDGPSEVHVLEFPSEPDLDAYMNDDRRLELAADRDRWVARSEVFRVQPV